MKSLACCFDLDMTDYIGPSQTWDELEEVWPVFMQCCRKLPEWKTTWFVRIDQHMEDSFGQADYIFQKHGDKIGWLKENGHELGWHFHSYRQVGGKWIQNGSEASVSEEMKSMFPLLQKHGLKIMRMGWAYHTNLTMKTAAEMGFILDCSAFPRALYHWDNKYRNWSQTGQDPYYPSVDDYQVSGATNYTMLEVPISTVPIYSEGDTDERVMRYINPVYFHEVFVQAVKRYRGNTLNLAAHPYEFLEEKGKHPLMSFDKNEMVRNLRWLMDQGYRFETISSLVEG
jgi:hypothetical protein